MEDIVIALQHISKTFASVKALNDVGFSICAGEVHALMGENGAGKSTLIKVLTGVYEPDTGAEIQVGAERFTQLTPLEAVKKGIAVTYQDFSLFPNLTVAENISISSEVEKNTGILSWRRMRDNAREVMEKMKIDIDPDAQLGALSAAKQQLVAIARALVHDAKLLILDEPTSALSANEVDKLFGIIDQLRKQGLAILFVSHKIDEVFRISDRITVLRDGTYIGTYPVQEVTPDDIINRMVGRNVEYERCTSENVKENVLLEVRGLTKAGNYKDIVGYKRIYNCTMADVIKCIYRAFGGEQINLKGFPEADKIVKLRKENAVLQKEISNVNEAKANTKSLNDNYEILIGDLKRHIKYLEGSVSWRITRPLRKVRALQKRIMEK